MADRPANADLIQHDPTSSATTPYHLICPSCIFKNKINAGTLAAPQKNRSSTAIHTAPCGTSQRNKRKTSYPAKIAIPPHIIHKMNRSCPSITSVIETFCSEKKLLFSEFPPCQNKQNCRSAHQYRFLPSPKKGD